MNKIKRIIESYPKTEYTLIELEDAKLQPFVVCYKLDILSNTWAQGHYFSNEFSARIFAMQKEIEKLHEMRMGDLDQISDYIIKIEEMLDYLYETIDKLPIKEG